jgi:hypothetical protein
MMRTQTSRCEQRRALDFISRLECLGSLSTRGTPSPLITLTHNGCMPALVLLRSLDACGVGFRGYLAIVVFYLVCFVFLWGCPIKASSAWNITGTPNKLPGSKGRAECQSTSRPREAEQFGLHAEDFVTSGLGVSRPADTTAVCSHSLCIPCFHSVPLVSFRQKSFAASGLGGPPDPGASDVCMDKPEKSGLLAKSTTSLGGSEPGLPG